MKSDDKGDVIAVSVCRHETGEIVVMNSALVSEGRNHFLIAGMDDRSVIYSFLMKMVTPKDGNTTSECEVFLVLVSIYTSWEHSFDTYYIVEYILYLCD